MLGSALTLALAIIASHGAPEDVSPTELWAGHQISYGSQRIPFRDEVTTRMDAVVLARVTREHGRIVLEQEACRVWFQPVGRMKISMRSDSFSGHAHELQRCW